MTQITKEEANKVLAKMVLDVENSVTACEDYAAEHGLDFGLNIAYGMGGTFVADPESMEDYDISDAGWQSSSSSC